MVSTVPSPSTSTAPPSRTNGIAKRAPGSRASAAIALGDLVVVLEHVLAAPAVEREPRRRQPRRSRPREEDRRRVAQPDVAERDAVEPRAGRRRAPAARGAPASRRARGPRRLALRDRTDQAREGVARGREVLLPEVGVARPRHPGRRVAGPLGGHAEAGFARAHGRAGIAQLSAPIDSSRSERPRGRSRGSCRRASRRGRAAGHRDPAAPRGARPRAARRAMRRGQRSMANVATTWLAPRPAASDVRHGVALDAP